MDNYIHTMSGKSNILPETEAQIVSRYSEVGRSGIVAKEFGINRKTVTNIVRRNGAEVLKQQIASGRRPLDTSPLHGRILELRKSGMSQQRISAEVGISQAVVARALRKMGMPTTTRLTGSRHPNYKGGRILSGGNYIAILVGPDDTIGQEMATRMGYVLEHRLVMAHSIGRPLKDYESVHHINGDKQDNRLENLQLRHTWHGKGVVMVCCNCGSHNVAPSRLKD